MPIYGVTTRQQKTGQFCTGDSDFWSILQTPDFSRIYYRQRITVARRKRPGLSTGPSAITRAAEAFYTDEKPTVNPVGSKSA